MANGFRTSSEISFKFLEKGVDKKNHIQFDLLITDVRSGVCNVYDFERHFGRLPLL